MKLSLTTDFVQLGDAFYDLVTPSPLADSHLVHANTAAAELLGITQTNISSDAFLRCFSGEQLPTNAQPLAMVYAGHQFGHYVPQLGDGRALLLGEIINTHGECWDVQLKGAGKTPYSRMGDGRAVLRSTIREYLCSEAMHALSIPTTRALCLTASSEAVFREQSEPGAILTRLSQSHIRFGHFEYFFYQQQHANLVKLANYVLTRHYPEQPHDKTGYAYLFEQAVINTAKTVAAWQAVGFCHGVMNTDNMSILGLTIDYGPFGFLDRYNPHHICNHSDTSGRYAYDQQPTVAHWNLMALAQALTPLLNQSRLNELLARFHPALIEHYSLLMRQKLGLQQSHQDDMVLSSDFLTLMEQHSADYTNSWRALSHYRVGEQSSRLHDIFSNSDALTAWLNRYNARLDRENRTEQQRTKAMQAANPNYILRNHLAHTAIQQAYEHRDYTEIDTLYTLLQQPYAEQPGRQHYAKTPPKWSESLEVSCSS